MKKMLSFLAFFAFFSALFLRTAHAYIDPGSMTFVIQAVASVFIAAGAAIGFNWRRLKRAISKRKERNAAKRAGLSVPAENAADQNAADDNGYNDEYDDEYDEDEDSEDSDDEEDSEDSDDEEDSEDEDDEDDGENS